MNSIIRSILAPFASAASGAIIAIIVAIFLFGVQDRGFLKLFALIGAFFGAVPEILRLISDFSKSVHALESFPTSKQPALLRTEQSGTEKERTKKADLQREEKSKLLAQEQDARRPICAHCSNKTEPIYTYKKANGAPDLRYKNNPLLCNKCFKPYARVRAWKLHQLPSDT